MLPNTDKTGGALTRIHDAFLSEDQSAIPWPLDTSPYDRREVERGRRSWVLRMLDEYRSMVAFSELASQLTALGAPLDVVGATARVVRDEVRHV
ncbi:MAG: hypothetical protein L0206_23640, partial [Actinobacteria bacterium]|nr:hypothetical protein [Actinomycetota bacterium]